MAAGTWTFPDGARTDIANGVLAIAADTYKCALFLSTSNIGAASTTYAGLTNEHANANGYTHGRDRGRPDPRGHDDRHL